MKSKKLKVLLLFLAGLNLFPGCKNYAQNQQDETSKTSGYVVEIKVIDYAFQMPSEIKSGWVTFKFDNMGHEMHFAQIFKLPENVIEEGFLKFTANPGKEIFQKYIKGYPILIGGPRFHAPGQESEYTIQQQFVVR